MPLYRLPPRMSQEALQRRGLVERAITIMLLVIFQHIFDIISLVFGGLSVYFICARIPLRAWQSSQRHLGFVSGDDTVLKAHRWHISLALAIIHGLLLVNWFAAVMRCRWLARRRRMRAGHWERPQNKAVIQVDDPARDLEVNW
ncbi:hypothetical protein FJTKL_09390 [Diaporthe vaccinii]|uniref:Uncharacterized protein n=1 Tax=Diaporthe vaccinii TaxID=105482 RepID=A0ABR4FCJ9_9PEZI